MADSIESFVTKLQNEGVEAGKQQAEAIRSEAQQEADRIVQEAQEQARRITQEADQQARETRQRAQTDLELAARDTVLRLRDTLGRALRAVLVTGAEQPMRDPEFLKGLIRDVVMQYARADREGQVGIHVNVGEDIQGQLADWCRAQLAPEAHGAGIQVDLRGTLREAGFEYEVEGANVEVTRQSVVEVLSDLVSPRLREIVEKATSEESGEQAPGNP